MAELSLNQLYNLFNAQVAYLQSQVNTKQAIIVESPTVRWFTDAERSKLSGIAAGAEVNQYTFGKVKVGTVTMASTSEVDTLELIAGTNLTMSADSSGRKVTINASAAPYTHPANHPAAMIVQDSSNRFVTDYQITQWNGAASGAHTHTKSQITDFAHTHTAADISGAIPLATAATTAINLPTSDIGGNVWIAATVSGIEGTAGAVATGSSTAPASPVVNQIWFDVTNRVIRFWDGASWQIFGAAYM